MVPLGLYMIKGDNVYVHPLIHPSSLMSRPFDPADRVSVVQMLTAARAMVAEMDEEKDATIDYTEIKAEPLAEIRF